MNRLVILVRGGSVVRIARTPSNTDHVFIPSERVEIVDVDSLHEACSPEAVEEIIQEAFLNTKTIY